MILRKNWQIFVQIEIVRRLVELRHRQNLSFEEILGITWDDFCVTREFRSVAYPQRDMTALGTDYPDVIELMEQIDKMLRVHWQLYTTMKRYGPYHDVFTVQPSFFFASDVASLQAATQVITILRRRRQLQRLASVADHYSTKPTFWIADDPPADGIATQRMVKALLLKYWPWGDTP